MPRPASVVPLVALAAVSLFATACRQPPPTPPRPVPTVTVVRPTVETVTEYLYYDGTIAAVDTAQIRARVPGYLERIVFNDSSTVQAGDLLFVIEQGPYRVVEQQARAQLMRAEAERDAAKVRRDLVKQAFDNGAATELELVEAEARLSVDEAAIAQATAELEQAMLNLEYTEVRAPFDGAIDRSMVDVGNLVGDGERTLLATVIAADRVHVMFEASERVVLRYVARDTERGTDGSIGDGTRTPPPIELGRLVDDGYPFTGTVDYVDNVVDPFTGTLTVRATLDNSSRQLIPGLFARIRAPFDLIEDAVLVEENAVQTGIDGRFVLVVGPDNMVERRRIEVGSQDGTRLVVRSGLSADERYIVRGIQFARPGLPVNPVEPEAAPAAAGGDAAPPAPAGDAPTTTPTDG